MTRSGNDQSLNAAIAPALPVSMRNRDVLASRTGHFDRDNMAAISRVNLRAAMNVACCKHIEVIERGKHVLQHALLIAGSARACIADRRISQRMDTPVLHTPGHRRRLSAQPMRLGLVLTLLLSTLLPDGRAFAEESLRDQLEAWWNQTQAGKRGQVGQVRQASSGSGARTARHVAKRGRHVANARAEAGGGVFDHDSGPRRDRPGRYFLHGPRF